jgi:hypothetical protein
MRIINARLVLVLGLAGCGAGAASNIRGQAAKDMSCPEADVQVTSAAKFNAGANDSGAYYAEGCKQIRRYVVGCNAMGLCTSPEGTDILAVVKKQAGFDLKCDDSAVTVRHLNTDTFGATGCDRQASYLLFCQSDNCRVVQNTQTQ